MKAEPGLLDVLTGGADWAGRIQPTGVPRLSVLCGERFLHGDEQVAEPWDFGPLLEDLGRSYRLILIDAASLAHPEVAPIARYCEGTYLVVQLGRATRRMLSEAVRAIEDCQGRLLGTIVVE